jgi:hypothetical protein
VWINCQQDICSEIFPEIKYFETKEIRKDQITEICEDKILTVINTSECTEDNDKEILELYSQVDSKSVLLNYRNRKLLNHMTGEEVKSDFILGLVMDSISETFQKMDEIIIDQNRTIDIASWFNTKFYRNSFSLKLVLKNFISLKNIRRIRLDYFVLLCTFVILTILAKNDLTIFSWDPAFYAERSMDLVNGFNWNTPKLNFYAVIDAISNKPPLLVWVGAVFYLFLGVFTINFPFLFAIAVFTTLNGFLLIKIIYSLTSSTKQLKSILALLILFTSPLYLEMSQNYFVEILQVFVILYAINIFTKLKTRSLTWKISNLGIISCLTLLVKIPTLLLTGPIIAIILVKIIKEKQSKQQEKYVKKDIFLTVTFMVLTIFTLVWYFKNFSSSFGFAKSLSVGELSEMYGARSGLIQKFKLWTNLLLDNVTNNKFIWIFLLLTYFALILHIFLNLKNSKFLIKKYKNEFLFITIITIYFFALTMQTNEDPRFLTPLIPIIILTAILILDKINLSKITFNPGRFLTIVIVLAILISEYSTFVDKGNSYLWHQDKDSLNVQSDNTLDSLKKLDKIICQPQKSTIFAVDVIDINYNTQKFISSYERGGNNSNCKYNYLAFNSDLLTTLDYVNNFDLVVSDSRLKMLGYTPQPSFTNVLSRDVFKYLSSSDFWKPIAIEGSTIIVFEKKSVNFN